MSRTGIEWTDRVWNPVTGCTKVSAGCTHCYAETMMRRFGKGRAFTDVQCHTDRLDQPLHWSKPSRVFVNSMSDLFHPAVPDEFIDWIFAAMALSGQHIFQILTKRPKRMRAYITQDRMALIEGRAKRLWREHLGDPMRPLLIGKTLVGSWPWPNLWLGISAEDQATLDLRWDSLRLTPAAVRFLSLEPLFGEIDFQPMYEYIGDICDPLDSPQKHPLVLPDWVVVGGESGPRAQPCDVAWIRSIVQQCKAARIPCFVKQLGAHIRATGSAMGGWPINQVQGLWSDCSVDPPRIHVTNRKGADPAEWPEDLRVREMP